MPQILAAAIVWAIPATAAVVAGVTIATYIATAVVLIGTLAYSASQQRKAERIARAKFDASQVDRLANVPATVVQRELVMGRLRKGGNVFFRGSTDPFQSTFVMCITLAAHEIDAVEQIYFNDVAVTIDGAGNVLTAPYSRYRRISASHNLTAAVTVLSGTPLLGGRDGADGFPGSLLKYVDGVPAAAPYTLAGSTITITGYDASPNVTYHFTYEYTVLDTFANVRWKLGAPGQTADAELQGLFPGVWTAAQRVEGIAYLICRFQYDENALPSGLPNVTALVRGAKLYDPRSGLTIWAENPALMMRHVITHPQFGKRTSMTAAENARIATAANNCDLPLDFGEGLKLMYRAAIVMPFGATAREALDDISQAMGGHWAYAAGEFFLRAGVYQAPVLALTDADLAVVQRTGDGAVSQSPITISPHRAQAEKANVIAARIWDAAANYVMTPVAPFAPPAYAAADGGAELVQEVTLAAVFYAPQAYHISGIILRDARDPLTVMLPFKMRAYPVELFDNITLTLTRYGWAAKEFNVMGRTFSPDGFVMLTLKETAAAIYTWSAGFSPVGYAANTTLPRPWDIAAPKIISVTSAEADLIVQTDGTVLNAVRVTWALSAYIAVRQSGAIDVQYKVLPATAWRTITVAGDATQALIAGVPDKAFIVVRVRARNSLAASDWGPQFTIQANGKAAPPPNITTLNIAGSVISWKLTPRVADLAGFVFRFHYGNNSDWNSAAPLHTGILTDSPFDLLTRPAGVVTIMGKAIDTSGNVSVSAARIVMNLGDPLIANVVESWDFNALNWPFAAGEQSGWTIVATDPSAIALDSFYGTNDQTFYSEDTESFYEASAYGQMIYVSPEISVTAALAGSIMTLVATAQGTDLRIDFRLAGAGSFFELDADSFYGADAAPLYGGGPGEWQPWPGQMVAAREVYQFRVTIGAGTDRGILQGLVVTIDAPDIEESVADLAIGSGGTTIPLSKSFTVIKVVQATLQANASAAITVEITKTLPLAPVIRAFNAAHTAVSGSTADVVVKGY